MTTLFEQEIRSQGSILRERAARGREQAQSVADSWRDVSYALVAARGSSDNAAVFFQYLAGQELGLLVALAAPSLFEGAAPIGLDGAGVLAVSQSGRTPGLLAVIEHAAAQGRPHAAVTNDPASPLALAAERVIELGAGLERAVASSKTFSSTWHALAQLVEAIKGSPLEGLDELPDLVERTALWALETSLPSQALNVVGGLTVVGRGVGQSVAAEIALKIREVAGIRSESFAAPDFLHGPIGADGHGSTLMLIVTEELSDAVANELLVESRRVGTHTVVVRSPQRAGLASDEEIVLVESAPNWSIGLAQIVVGQVLALRLGELRGRPIDTNPGLKKVTLSA
ncbi:MAG: SIS domain-containing protein [Acidimicrobiales bacterium]|jgi:glucosamine--fructose-6-phosphate aminotransferase (isomerizing)